jgi:hypothetical protein
MHQIGAKSKLWLWIEDWQESKKAMFKVNAVKTFSSWKLKSILVPFQSGCCIW